MGRRIVPGATTGTRQVRRYANRKLYDAAAGGYVTLDELRAFVAAGGEIEVRDQKSGADLTAHVLAQIVLDGLRRSTARIPRQVLVSLVRLADAPPASWSQWPDPHAIASRAWDEAERIVGRLVARGRLTLDDALTLREELGESVHRLVADAQAGVDGRLRAVFDRAHGPTAASLEGLSSRLDSLEAYLDTPSPPRPKAAAKAPRRPRGRAS